ncbi:hypothetical protein [Mesorhizobium sp. M1B.F.Ca.ET.045.04.1.1]|uniref:hypothetical protein n=1 Tax=Mesorhizobium sp. M1B.F.Ca.ET.045.04.1.1 TaxID=2493673 RepID=UPI000F750586|nr:hypothetical protein [Mesorhizobium sp. M1B.F.Ca.ET.045.04.1.1]AZO32299.1 hypothetical protein EJ071_36395 [Mesorhizobium sp. M1B.F.Ca.ET.045.04.1.1]
MAALSVFRKSTLDWKAEPPATRISSEKLTLAISGEPSASSVWDDDDGTRQQKSRAKLQAAAEAGGVVVVGETEERAPGLVHIIGP